MKQGISSPPPPPPPPPLPPPASSLPPSVRFRALQWQHFTNTSLMASGIPRSFVKMNISLSNTALLCRTTQYKLLYIRSSVLPSALLDLEQLIIYLAGPSAFCMRISCFFSNALLVRGDRRRDLLIFLSITTSFFRSVAMISPVPVNFSGAPFVMALAPN